MQRHRCPGVLVRVFVGNDGRCLCLELQYGSVLEYDSPLLPVQLLEVDYSTHKSGLNVQKQQQV